jgi:hypothetical protein
MELFSFAEIIMAVAMVLGGQKGFEIYKRKRHSNGRHDRRSSSERSNSLAQADRDFIQECFKDQTREMGLAMKSDRLELVMNIEKAVRSEGEKTRTVVRASR